MGRKPKFKPRVTRIKLSPEQAVLRCYCYSAGLGQGPVGGPRSNNVCQAFGSKALLSD